MCVVWFLLFFLKPQYINLAKWYFQSRTILLLGKMMYREAITSLFSNRLFSIYQVQSQLQNTFLALSDIYYTNLALYNTFCYLITNQNQIGDRAKTWFLRKQYTHFTELLSLLVESYAVPLRVFYRSSTSNREKLVEEPNLFRNDKQIYMQRQIHIYPDQAKICETKCILLHHFMHTILYIWLFQQNTCH